MFFDTNYNNNPQKKSNRINDYYSDDSLPKNTDVVYAGNSVSLIAQAKGQDMVIPCLSIVSMTVFMARAGTPDSGGVLIFSVFSLLFIGAFIWLIRYDGFSHSLCVVV